MAVRANEDAVLRQPAEMFPAPEAWLALMSKSGAAFLDLQMRLVSCPSPIDLWSEQIRFIKGRIDDTTPFSKRSRLSYCVARPAVLRVVEGGSLAVSQ